MYKMECTVNLEVKNSVYKGKLVAKHTKGRGSKVDILTVKTDTLLSYNRVETRNQIIFFDDNIVTTFLWEAEEGYSVSFGISGQVDRKTGNLEIHSKYANSHLDFELAASSPNHRHLALQVQSTIEGSSINLTTLGEVLFADSEKSGNSVKWLTSHFVSLNLPQLKVISIVKGEWGKEWAELGGEVDIGFTSALLIAQGAASTSPAGQRLQVDVASNREGEISVDIISESEKEKRDRAVLRASLLLIEPVTVDWHLKASGSLSSIRITLHTDELYRFSYHHRQRSGELESPMIGVTWKLTSVQDFLLTVDAPQTSLGPGPIQLRLESVEGYWGLLCNTEELDLLFASGTMEYEDNGVIKIHGAGRAHIDGHQQPLEVTVFLTPSYETAHMMNMSLSAGKRHLNWEGSMGDSAFYLMSTYCSPALGSHCSVSSLAATIISTDNEEDIKAEGYLDLAPLSLDYSNMNFLMGYKKGPNSLLHTLTASWDNQSAVAYELEASQNKIGLSIGIGEEIIHLESSYKMGVGWMKGETQFWPSSGPEQATKFIIDAIIDGNDFNCSGSLSGPALERNLTGKIEIKGATRGKIEVDIFNSPRDKILADWSYNTADDGSDSSVAFTKVSTGDLILYDAKYNVDRNFIQGCYSTGPIKFFETLRVGFLSAVYTVNTTAGKLLETSLSPKGVYIKSEQGTVASLTTRSKFYVPIYSYYFNMTNFKLVKDLWWNEVSKVWDTKEQQIYKEVIDHLVTDFPAVKLWDYFGEQWKSLRNDLVTIIPSLEQYVSPAETAAEALSNSIISALSWGLGALREAVIACWDSALWAWDSVGTVLSIILPYWDEFSAQPFQAFYAETAQMLAGLSDSLIQDIVDMAKLAFEKIREHHLFETITDYYNELKGSMFGEEVRSDWEEVKTVAEQSATPEMRKLVDTIHHYSEQVRLGHAVDWVAAFTQISSEAAATMAPLIRDIMDQVAPSANLEELLRGYSVALPGLGVHKLWELAVGLSQGHIPLPVDLLARCYTFLFIPANLGSSIIVDGRVVTWDGKWLNLGSDGKYVLAKGIGFSLTAVTRRSHLYSIHLGTDTKDLGYYINSNKIVVNGKESDFPHWGEISAWLYPESIEIVSQNMSISCLRASPVCVVQILPSLFSSTSGLLGKFNHEPYDDFLFPNNTVSLSTRELVQSWADDMEIDFSIEDKKPDERRETFIQCQGLITRAPSLQWCSRLIDPAPYTSMCTDSLSPCLAAAAYTSSCLTVTPFTALPNLCVKCKQYIEETEGKRIDVVLLVEVKEGSPHKEAIQYVTKILRPVLNRQGFKSVSVYIIGYGQDIKNTIFFSDESSAEEKIIQIQRKHNNLYGWRELLRRIQIELGRTERDKALKQVVESSLWRPNSVRVILDAVSNSSCITDTPVTTLHRFIELIMESKLQRNGISFYTIDYSIPVEDISPIKEGIYEWTKSILRNLSGRPLCYAKKKVNINSPQSSSSLVGNLTFKSPASSCQCHLFKSIQSDLKCTPA